MEKRRINFKYINEKRLGFCDFIELIRGNLTKKITKNRGFMNEESKIIIFKSLYEDEKSFFSFSYSY